jgi:hypothetical protein
MEEHSERSGAAHRYFFKAVGSAFQNLSDEQRLLWPTEDSLRRYALCKAGCCDVATHVEPTEAAASRMALFLRSHGIGDFVTNDGTTVTVLTAWSMAYRAMNREKFREVADKTLPVLAEIIGVSASDLIDAEAA